MGNRISFFLLLAFVVLGAAGCRQSVRDPEIVGHEVRISPAPSPVPEVTIPPRTWAKYPTAWIPPRSKERKWKAIIIHHSAKPSGNMAEIDEYHRKFKGWDGVGYDFVIGNGHGSGDGDIEVTFRWKTQVAGAHCGGTVNNWANESGVGICLIGDFTKSRPTRRQMQSLTKLVNFLQSRYKIPATRIYGHRNTPTYTRGTECPGKYFPMESFKKSL